jgi:hypothetical protein
MTRDEARAKCIEMIGAALDRRGIFVSFEQAVAAFDALHGIAAVNLRDVTEEMADAARREAHGHKDDLQISVNRIPAVFAAMAATGDLTNAQEKSK